MKGYFKRRPKAKETLLDKPSIIYDYQFQERLINYFKKYSIHCLDRVPIILEAYQEHPDFLFGDLDLNYHSTLR